MYCYIITRSIPELLRAVAGFEGCALTLHGAQLDLHPQRPDRFLLLCAQAPIPCDDQESSFWPSSTPFRSFEYGPIVSAPIDCHRRRDGRGTNNQEGIQKSTIGSFTASRSGFTGTIKTLNLNVNATIRTIARTSDKDPDYRILAWATEFGAARKKSSNEGRDYLSVKLDDPSFPAPIYATLIEVEGKRASPSSGPGQTGTDPESPPDRAGLFL